MKRLGIPLLSLLFVFIAILVLQQSRRGPSTGFTPPDFSLRDLEGRVYRLADLRGKVVFLNLWATWCPPCREEMPSMEALYRRLKHRDFVMLAVSEDEAGAAVVKPFVESLGVTFPVLLDPEGRLPARYGVTGFPETFIIDKSGKLVTHQIGPANWESKEVVDFLLALLGRPPETPNEVALESR